MSFYAGMLTGIMMTFIVEFLLLALAFVVSRRASRPAPLVRPSTGVSPPIGGRGGPNG